jgi:branched-chain amino acid transport system permease protein
MGIGAYTAGFVGQNMGLPFPLWMAAAIVVPALFGAIVAQFALRLRGHYLVIVTFSLVLIGQHVFKNWTAVTNGAAGRPIQIGLDIFGWDVTRLQAISRDKVYFLVIWAFVAIIAYLTHNLVRSRVGRALMAVRDREITADVIGIDITYYKIAAFTISSGIGGVAGAFYGAFVQYTNPAEWSILLGVQYLAVIVVGGIGSVAGSIIGALVITILPYGVEVFSPYVPLIARNPGDPGIITLFALNQVLFGSVIILFLIFAPRGLADLLRRAVRRVAVRQ